MDVKLRIQICFEKYRRLLNFCTFYLEIANKNIILHKIIIYQTSCKIKLIVLYTWFYTSKDIAIPTSC